MLSDCLSDKQSAAEAIGALATLGYPSPEATAPGHPKRPSCPLGRHKDDVHAVGVMGLLFLSPESRMPFGPSKGQWDRVQRDPTALQEVKKSVISNHKAWVSHAYAVHADVGYHNFMLQFFGIMLIHVLTTSCMHCLTAACGYNQEAGLLSHALYGVLANRRGSWQGLSPGVNEQCTFGAGG